MATVSDELITKISLDDSNYKSGAKGVQSATMGMKTAIDGAFGKVGITNVTQGLGSIMGFASRAAVVVGGLAAGFSALAWKGIQASAEFDTMGKTLGGALGDMKAGVEMLKALEGYANKSAYGLTDLASAATKLSAGGLDIGRYLPIIERFALVISGTDPSGLEQVVGALIRAKGGGFGEAMENIRRAGVGVQDFEAIGANKFNKGGQWTGTPDEFLEALVKVSEGRLKNIADAVMKSDAVKLSNLFDSMGQALRQFGAVVSAAALPGLVALTNKIKELVDNGKIAELTTAFMDLLPALKPESIGAAVDSIILSFQSLAESATKLTSFWTDFFSGKSKEGDSLGMKWAKAFVNNNPWQRAFGWLRGKVSDFYTGDTMAGQQDPQSRKYWEDVAKKKPSSSKLPSAAGTQTQPAPSALLSGEEALKKLAGIEYNTKRTADFQRMILGGGEAGRMGVTPVELHGLRGGKWGKVVEAIRDAVIDESSMMQRGMKQARLAMS
jgi:hypothetical protein